MSRRRSSSSTSFFGLWHLILILSIVLCSCEARPIGEMKKQDESSRSSQFYSKDDKKSSQGRVSDSSNAKSSNQNEKKVAKMVGSLIEKDEAKKQPESASPRKIKNQQELIDGHHEKKFKGADNGKSDCQSGSTVTWKVPHPKSGERQPGFNLDYDPPQTHTPVHN